VNLDESVLDEMLLTHISKRGPLSNKINFLGSMKAVCNLRAVIAATPHEFTL